MWDQISQLHAYHGHMPAEFSVLKLTEEVGEVAEALIGVKGINARKGVCHTTGDLLDELADVLITAAVTMCDVAEGGPDEARLRLEHRLRVVSARAGLVLPDADHAGGRVPGLTGDGPR